METIKLSLDREMFWQKPAGKDVPKINNRIAWTKGMPVNANFFC